MPRAYLAGVWARWVHTELFAGTIPVCDIPNIHPIEPPETVGDDPEQH